MGLWISSLWALVSMVLYNCSPLKQSCWAKYWRNQSRTFLDVYLNDTFCNLQSWTTSPYQKLRELVWRWRWSASACARAIQLSNCGPLLVCFRRGAGKGLGKLRGKRGMKSVQEIAERHDLQTLRSRRMSRPLPIGGNSSSGSSEHSTLSLMSCVCWLTWLLHNDYYLSSLLVFCGI